MVKNDWLGTSTRKLVSCKAEFSGEPEHLNYICQKDGDRLVVRCSGWRNPMNLHFVTKPPFLIFDISLLFTNELTHLSCLPYEVSAYGDKYRLGGATSHVSSRAHYVGYVSISNNQFLFYDGLPSQKPILKPCTQTTIHGKISLLIYFPVNEVAMKTDCDAEIICSDTTEKDFVIKNNNSSPKVKKEPIRSTGHVKLRQNPKKSVYQQIGLSSVKWWIRTKVTRRVQAMTSISFQLKHLFSKHEDKNPLSNILRRLHKCEYCLTCIVQHRIPTLNYISFIIIKAAAFFIML